MRNNAVIVSRDAFNSSDPYDLVNANIDVVNALFITCLMKMKFQKMPCEVII